jgi:hypothetical protein
LNWNASCTIPRGADETILLELLQEMKPSDVTIPETTMALESAITVLPVLIVSSGVAGPGDPMDSYSPQHAVLVEVSGTSNPSNKPGESDAYDRMTISLTQVEDADDSKFPDGT